MSRGDESAVTLPPSDCSPGICTFKRGRFTFMGALFVREMVGFRGGGGSETEDEAGWERSEDVGCVDGAGTGAAAAEVVTL